jgi:hypothetical protein
LAVWSSCLWPAAVRSEELAVALSTTPDSTSTNAWPAGPCQALPRPIPGPIGLRAFRNVPSSADVRADYAAFCTLVHSAAVLRIETDSISAIGPRRCRGFKTSQCALRLRGEAHRFKTSQCAPRLERTAAELKTSQCALRLGGAATKFKTSQCAPRLGRVGARGSMNQRKELCCTRPITVAYGFATKKQRTKFAKKNDL